MASIDEQLDSLYQIADDATSLLSWFKEHDIDTTRLSEELESSRNSSSRVAKEFLYYTYKPAVKPSKEVSYANKPVASDSSIR